MNSLNDVIDAAKQAAAAKDFIKCRLEKIFKALFNLWLGKSVDFEINFYPTENLRFVDFLGNRGGNWSTGPENINISQFLDANLEEDDFNDFSLSPMHPFKVDDDVKNDLNLANGVPVRWLDPNFDFLTEATRWKDRHEDKKRREEEAKKKDEEELRRAQQENQAKKKKSRENYSLMMKGICSKLTAEEKQWLFKDGVVKNLPEPPGKSGL